MRPVIGITSYAQDARWGVWHLPAALVPLAYVDAIERAGGRALVVPPAEDDVEDSWRVIEASTSKLPWPLRPGWLPEMSGTAAVREVASQPIENLWLTVSPSPSTVAMRVMMTARS